MSMLEEAAQVHDKTSSAPAVSAVGLVKNYGATFALDDVSLDIEAGTIHALVGENGAGKSTFAGVIAGRVEPSEGSLSLFGEPAQMGKPQAAVSAGVATIYQELTIVPNLSTQANLFLGSPRSRFGVLREREMREELASACAALGVDIPPDIRAGDLSIADQQVLEILRALKSEPKLILFDEPTASLARGEREALLALMKGLRERGVTQVIVSHDLSEVFAVADQATAFREGRIVASRPVSGWTRSTMAQEIRGDRGEAQIGDSRSRAAAATLLEVRDWQVRGDGPRLSMRIEHGEVLGIAGLVGSGRSSLLKSLFGMDPAVTGQMEIDGKAAPLPRSPRRALASGIALIPDDRKKSGIVPVTNAASNVIMADLRSVARGFLFGATSVRTSAEKSTQPYGVPAHRLDVAAGLLSGGTQQKLLFARWDHRPVKVLLADEPTRGIDLGAKAEILAAIRAKAKAGLGVIITSNEPEDLAAVCDRVIIMRDGEIVAERTADHQPIPESWIIEHVHEESTHE
jgi:ABC-type sugar transport system ATPase subunit